MPPAGLRRRVEAIPGSPLPHGILAGCSEVVDVDDVHELLGIEWLALGCCPVRDWPDPCADESPGSESPGAVPVKEFCRPQAEHADPITLYAAAECGSIGWSYAEAREQVLATLELGEQRGLEEAFWRNQLAPNAVDLTPDAGPVSIAQGVAALEGCLAESYGGVGVLHVPAGAAALLGCCNLVREFGDGLRTLAGNCVTISAGASAINEGPDGMPAPPGTAWLAISGPVHIRRGPIEIIPDRTGAALDTRTNTLRLIAERTYVVATTCQVCMIQIEVCPT